MKVEDLRVVDRGTDPLGFQVGLMSPLRDEFYRAIRSRYRTRKNGCENDDVDDAKEFNEDRKRDEQKEP